MIKGIQVLESDRNYHLGSEMVDLVGQLGASLDVHEAHLRSGLFRVV